MTFPRTLLIEIQLDGVWTNITSYVLQSPPVQLTRGLANEAARVAPSLLTLSLDNRDERFSPQNPTSPYYGKLGRNTPIRTSVNGTRRFWGEISSLKPGWNLSLDFKTMQIEASGVLRRLSQGSSPVQSAPRRYVPTSDPGLVAYWPLEDGPLSTEGVPAAGSESMTLIAADKPASQHFGEGKLGPWLNVGVAMFGGDSLRGSVNAPQFAGEWTVDHVRAGNTTADNTMTILCGTHTWVITFKQNTNSIRVDYPSSFFEWVIEQDLWDGDAHHVRFVADQQGADTAFYLDVDGDRTPIGGLLAGLTNQPINEVRFDDLAAHDDPFAIGHVCVYVNSRPLADFADPALGYLGETAGRRIQRICEEEGISFASVGNLDNTTPMGPQRPATVLELLNECVTADIGQLYESRNALGLEYRTRGSLYNQTPKLTLDFSAGQVSEPFVPIDDDQLTRNEVKIKRTLGGEYTETLTTGRLSVLSPPDGIGRYDTSVEVNINSQSQLAPIAQWLLHLGTIDGARYPQLCVNMTSPDVDDSAMTVGIDDVVVITDASAIGVYDDIYLLARGSTEVLSGQTEHMVTFNCAPASPYSVAVLDSSTRGRLNPGTSTLTAGITASATSFSVTSTTAWTTAGMPIPIIIGGETMSVIAISGSSSPQTFTVVRSVNGVQKAHSAGASVEIAPHARARLAL